MSAYEHLHWDITPAALAEVAEAIDARLASVFEESTYQELQNLANECRARVQHAAIGMPDLSSAYRLLNRKLDRCAGLAVEAPAEDWLA